MTAGGPLLRILLVEGDLRLRQALTSSLAELGGIEVELGTRNGRAAEPRVQLLAPDLVLVDLANDLYLGVELLQGLASAQHPAARVALVPTATRAAVQTQLAGLPRTTVVERPPASDATSLATAIARALVPQLRSLEAGLRPASRLPLVVGLGASTGGPRALTTVLGSLAADFPLPIVVVQHMPARFTASFADTLARSCRLPVREASHGSPLVRGEVLIAPGGVHLRVVGRPHTAHCELTQDPPEQSCRPAVDYLFRSLGAVYGGQVLAAVLTGMGEDGWRGARDLYGLGAHLLAQDEATSTVFGMPRGPITAGIARALPLAAIGPALAQAAHSRVCR